jgi:preprotein translocase subunit YajC
MPRKFFRTRQGLSMISPAFAQTSGAGGSDLLGLFFPLILVFGIFYLLVFRPQQKKMKEHQGMIDAVKRGDTVVTSGGIIGKVIRVGADGELRVEIADNVQVRLLKGSITDVRGKGEPVKEKVKAETPSGGDGDGTQPGA